MWTLVSGEGLLSVHLVYDWFGQLVLFRPAPSPAALAVTIVPPPQYMST